MSSGGNNDSTFTSSPSRSLTALAYSVRFRRCRTGRPGFGSAAAARSISRSSPSTNTASVASSGRGRRAGGISPARSFRITFSRVATCALGCAGSTSASERSPCRSRSLWHVTQYWSNSARVGTAGSSVVAVCEATSETGAGGWAATTAADASSTTAPRSNRGCRGRMAAHRALRAHTTLSMPHRVDHSPGISKGIVGSSTLGRQESVEASRLRRLLVQLLESGER